MISKARLREFWRFYPDAEVPLTAWWRQAITSDWAKLSDVRAVYPHADAVKLPCGLVVTVFNIGGNKYRLVTRIIYEYRRVYVKLVLTHAAYDSPRWKEQLCREHLDE